MKRNAGMIVGALAGGAVLALVTLTGPVTNVAPPAVAADSIVAPIPSAVGVDSLHHRCKWTIRHPCRRR